MNKERIEYLKNGKRLCKCSDVILQVEQFELQTIKPWSSNNLRNLILNVIKGIRYGTPKFGWQAICPQCKKIYLITNGKSKKSFNALVKQVEDSGINFYHKDRN